MGIRRPPAASVQVSLFLRTNPVRVSPGHLLGLGGHKLSPTLAERSDRAACPSQTLAVLARSPEAPVVDGEVD
jgi:hypothetical protein